jgi:hypothetical protein
MPYYTEGYPFCVTLPNDIRKNDPNPFASTGIFDESYVNGVGQSVYEVSRSLDVDSKLSDGISENRKRLYYKNLYSASTTAGYTNLRQQLFVSKSKVITGWQNKF